MKKSFEFEDKSRNSIIAVKSIQEKEKFYLDDVPGIIIKVINEITLYTTDLNKNTDYNNTKRMVF